MNSVDFIRDAVRTEAPITEETEYRMTEAARALHGAMGLCTEAGELMDAYKKHIFYGKPLDVTNIKEELGDVLWYVAELCDVYNFTFEELMELCIAKLRKRYPQKFTSDAALNRDLTEERKVLEASPMMKLAQGILNNETLPKLSEVHGPLREYTGQTIDLEAAKSIGVTNNPTTLPKSEWIGHWPSDVEEPQDKVAYDSRDSVPLKVVGTPYKNLIALYGEEHVFAMRRQFGEEFFANMNRRASVEDIDMFYFRWWKAEVRKSERPEQKVR